MAVGPYCPRCETHVRLEQDGHACSNCGANIVKPNAYRTPPPTAAQPKTTPAKPAKEKS